MKTSNNTITKTPVKPSILDFNYKTPLKLRKPMSNYQESKENHEEKNLPLERKIVIMDKQECVFLKIDDISYVEANGSYTDVYTRFGQKIVVSKSIKIFSDRLPENEFVRVHKSFLINVNFIKKYVRSDGGYIIMEDDTTIPVSVRKRDIFMRLLGQFCL